VTPLAGGKIEATVTLSDHGTRSLPSPAPEETAEADQHQEIAAAFGV
jgi:hypothetical protein